jgi:hypothetical protein
MSNFGLDRTMIRLNRRGALATFGVVAASLSPIAAFAQTSVYTVVVHRSSGCSCCHAWAVSLETTGRFRARLVDEADMSALRRRLGVPGDLEGCHTAEVGGFVIEGHVPASDILRLLAERPAHVRGLAVRGMPIGSPGMEAPGARAEAYEVVAFGADGARSVFARHG